MSTANTKRIKELLAAFEFQELFVEELGWERQRGKHNIAVGDDIYEVAPFAEKKGLVAFACHPVASASFPDSATRKRIEKEVTGLHFEHLIVFIDPNKTRQIWQVPRREGGKTKGHSEIPYFAGKGVEHLARRIEQISFTLGETDEVSLLEVSARVNQALLAEKVTKKFFKEFSDKRKGFVKFLEWIEDEAKRDWYCSVLLNRLMFIYFLGGKGFLPGGTGFLAHSLNENINKNGPDTFYTNFLLPLSFFGLGERQGQRGRFEATFKDVLYLDGGLFAVHQVERELGLDKNAVDRGTLPEGARIPDEQFKKWFAYFDDWRWTLDEDKVENDGYISPHILGYIFEKYINQKQMGAYYTKEDITGYICRNTIIPRLFDMLAETGGKGKQAVQPLPVGPHPNLLNEGRGISDGEGIDRYVYASVKQDDKLPTETDYEQSQRRKRYEGILTDFDAGKIAAIDDFITYNLDIERLALDFISNIQDPEVLHAIYFRGLQQITVLDPTCGSGAFLFAALNILYPLYNAALSRMRYLVGKATGSEPDVVNWAGRLNFDDLEAGQGVFADTVGAEPKVVAELRFEVERINEHPNAEYFIKKSIIVNNLFGVDIMEEAVEICKLRLFLTLIATVERDDAKDNFGVEPLPDIDFNILAGNTLVGYTSIADIDRLWHEVEVQNSTLAFEKDHSRLKFLIAEYGKLLAGWRQQQLGEWRGARITKEQVLAAVEAVRPELNKDLWNLYKDAGKANVVVGKKSRALTQVEFSNSHQPFHWMLEFPEVEANRGFDVLIGNPPYVELKDVANYSMIGFYTLACGDLYALVAERAFRQVSPRGRTSFIVPISMFNTDGFRPLQRVALEASRCLWVSTYSNRPSQLFDGAQKRLTIYISKADQAQGVLTSALYTSRYLRWTKAERDVLIAARVGYASRGSGSFVVLAGSLEKLGSGVELSAFDKIAQGQGALGDATVDGGNEIVYYTRKFGYFLAFLDFVPSIVRIQDRSTIPPSELKRIEFPDRETSLCAIALLSSSTFFWFWNVLSDVRNVNKRDLLAFPCDPRRIEPDRRRSLALLAEQYLANLRQSTSVMTKSGLQIQTFDHASQKPILDQIDHVIAEVYGFSDTELQFILNYDVKYRLGNTDQDEE